MLKPTNAKSPTDYIRQIDEPRRSQITTLDRLIRETAPDLKRHLLAGMLAYGTYHYKYASGREGDWCVIALASQKNYISVYACACVDGEYVAERYKPKLPKANIGKSCIRFKKLEDIDLDVLREVVRETASAQERAM